jgi:ABC-2 type transport system permease protein
LSVTRASEAKRGTLSIVPDALSTLYSKRWLIFYFIQRELASSYRKSFLGFLWIVLTPLLMIALYTLVFSEIVGLRFREVEGQGVANFGLYLYCGLIPFLAFTGSINQSVNTIRGNSNLVQRVVFPLEILPLSSTLTSFIANSSGLAVLISIVLVLERQLHWTLVLLPAIMVLQLVLTLGLSYLMSVLGAYLPDIRQVTQAVTRALFFMTPIIWPPELAYERGFGFIIDYNPVAFVVMSYRDLVLNGELPALAPSLWWTLLAVVLLTVSFTLFVASKKHFADLI